MSKLFLNLWPWTWLLPIVLCGSAISLARRLSRGRWLLHFAVVLLMLAMLPLPIYLQGLADPTTIEHPGPGDGFAFLLYIMALISSLVAYLLAAWVIRSNNRMARTNANHHRPLTLE